MPIYEYVCQECGHALDALQKIADAPLTDCPECQQAALKRKISAPSFRLKGQGWYETDFKKDNRRNLADGDNKPAAAKEGGKDAKTEKSSDGGASKEKSKPSGGDGKSASA